MKINTVYSWLIELAYVIALAMVGYAAFNGDVVTFMLAALIVYCCTYATRIIDRKKIRGEW